MSNSPFSSSMKEATSTVTAIMNSDSAGMKKHLADFFTGAKVFARIQRSDAGITEVTIQGNSDLLQCALKYLKELLFICYGAAIVWKEDSSQGSLTTVSIQDTPLDLKRDLSSGEFAERNFDDISLGGSAATENLKKIMVESFSTLASNFAVANKIIPAIKEKHISVQFKEEIFDVEVSSMKSTAELLLKIDSIFKQPVPFKTLYRLSENDKVHLFQDIVDIREGFLYHAITVNEELPNK